MSLRGELRVLPGGSRRHHFLLLRKLRRNESPVTGRDGTSPQRGLRYWVGGGVPLRPFRVWVPLWEDWPPTTNRGRWREDPAERGCSWEAGRCGSAEVGSPVVNWGSSQWPPLWTRHAVIHLWSISRVPGAGPRCLTWITRLNPHCSRGGRRGSLPICPLAEASGGPVTDPRSQHWSAMEPRCEPGLRFRVLGGGLRGAGLRRGRSLWVLAAQASGESLVGSRCSGSVRRTSE